MIEYAITHGEGTLLAYGVADKVANYSGEITIVPVWEHPVKDIIVPKSATLIVRECPDDCETGK